MAHLLELREAPLERHPGARGPLAALRLRLDQPGPVLQLLSQGREPIPELADGAQRTAWREGTRTPRAVAGPGAPPGVHGGVQASAEQRLRPQSRAHQARAGTLQGGRMGDARRGDARHGDRPSAQPQLHRRLVLRGSPEPVVGRQSRPRGYQDDGSVARGFAVAVPEPDRQIRRQLASLGSRSHAGACPAQLVR